MNATELTGHNPKTLNEIAKCRTTHFGNWIFDARSELALMHGLVSDKSLDPEMRIKASAQACKLRDQLMDMISVPKRPGAPVGPSTKVSLDITPT